MSNRGQEILLTKASLEALTDSDRRILDAAMAADPAMIDDLSERRRLVELLRDSAPEGFGRSFADRVVTAAFRRDEQIQALPRLRPLYAYMAAAAALVAITMTAVMTSVRTVVAEPGHVVAETLPDGSEVILRSGSKLRYRMFALRGERGTDLEGEAFFDVRRGSKPFVVRTHDAQVQVLGTRFNVRSWPDSEIGGTTVSLQSGRVRVAKDFATSESEVVLLPGESTVVPRDSVAPRPPFQTPSESLAIWRNGGLSFINQPLGDVVDDLERLYDTSILLSKTELARIRVGFKSTKPVELTAVLGAICSPHGLGFQRTVGGYEIVENDAGNEE